MTSVTQTEAREAIYLRWETQWVSTTPFLFQNEKFTADVDSPWARVSVSHEAGNQDTLGSVGGRKFLRRGRVFIQLYDSVDQGLRSLDVLSIQARDIFEGVTFSGIFFNNVDVREVGDDGEWFQVIVDAPFDYSETK